ncbi:hypothetical protein H6F56_20445 [Microcoleus sp. FACHB-672]|nr:hypothetical protein [Microcoleus sp. FACHB-672]
MKLNNLKENSLVCEGRINRAEEKRYNNSPQTRERAWGIKPKPVAFIDVYLPTQSGEG